MERSRFDNKNFHVGSVDVSGIYNTLVPKICYNPTSQEFSIELLKSIQIQVFNIHESLMVRQNFQLHLYTLFRPIAYFKFQTSPSVQNSNPI